MSFAVHTRTQPGVAGRDATIFVLEDGAGGRAEVWPALGFNCFRWQVVRDGRTLDLLYADPALFGDGRPTRSGVPILFPFPNRIRDGRFAWDGKEYRLPTNDPAGKNAIHGFACRRPWRVVDQGADASSAWVTGEFQRRPRRPGLPAALAGRLPPPRHLPPRAGPARVEAEVANPDRATAAIRTGLSSLFPSAVRAGADAADCLVRAPAQEMWTLVDSLPTGERRPVDAARDLNAPRRFGDLQLDDVLTGPAARAGRRTACATAAPSSRAPKRCGCSGVAGLPRHGRLHAAAPPGVLRRAVHLHHRRDQPASARRGRRPVDAAARRPLVGRRRDAARPRRPAERTHEPTHPGRPSPEPAAGPRGGARAGAAAAGRRARLAGRGRPPAARLRRRRGRLLPNGPVSGGKAARRAGRGRPRRAGGDAAGPVGPAGRIRDGGLHAGPRRRARAEDRHGGAGVPRPAAGRRPGRSGLPTNRTRFFRHSEEGLRPGPRTPHRPRRRALGAARRRPAAAAA